MHSGEVVIYEMPGSSVSIKGRLDNGSIWLSLNQIAELFGRDKSVISRHLRNIYRKEELVQKATVVKNATVQSEGGRELTRTIEFYNLDAIISVGYRVNSKQGTQFRIWANNVLQRYVLKGYSSNEKQLKEKKEELEQLKQTLRLLGNVLQAQPLSSDEATGLLKVITDYSYALDVLDKYDHQVLEIHDTTKEELYQITYIEATNAIHTLRKKFGGTNLFGNEKDESFQGSLAAIYQTFGGQYVYASVEEKASNLLYFVTKNHSFSTLFILMAVCFGLSFTSERGMTSALVVPSWSVMLPFPG